MMRKTLLLIVAAASLATAACNTISGVGRDMTSAGRAVTNSADDAR